MKRKEKDPFKLLEEALIEWVKPQYFAASLTAIIPFSILLFLMFSIFTYGTIPLDFILPAFFGILGLSIFIWLVQVGMSEKAEEKARKKIKEVTYVIPQQFIEGSVARLFDAFLSDLYRRIRDIYPEVPEYKIAKFLSELVKRAGKIEGDDEMIRRTKIQLAFEELSRKHKIPLFFSIHKAETLKAGACFYIFSIRRIDADEILVLSQVKQSVRLWALTPEEKARQ